MKECSICNQVFCSFDDVVKVDEKIYHEKCIEIVPIKYCAYIPEDEDGFLREFDADDNTFAADILAKGEYREEKQYDVTYLDALNEEGEISVWAADEEQAKEKIAEYHFLKPIKAILQEVADE
jgi:hypothetical protein